MSAKVAVITGAGRGIGQGCAEVFAQAGFQIVLAEKNMVWGEESLREIQEGGGEAVLIPADVSDETAVESLFSSVRGQYGRLDVLVNNAGTNQPGSILETSTALWDSLLDTNLKSAFLCSKYAIPLLLESGGGAIVNVSSMAGILGQANGIAYSTSKAGMIGLTRALALDHTRDGIRVNCIAPGNVGTPLMQEWILHQKDPEVVRRQVESAQLTDRLATTQEVGQMILFLAIQPFLSGVVLEADGGASLGY